MDKTDQAVASAIDQIAASIKDLSGPAYEAILASCKVNAQGEIATYYMQWGGVVAFALLFVLFLHYCLKVSEKNETRNDAGETALGWSAALAAIAGMILIFISIANVSTFVRAKATMQHPEVCIGQSLLTKVSK